MPAISYTEARDKLAAVWDETIATREPIIISRRGTESVVLVALEEWNGLTETAHLLRSPANAKRLLGALKRLSDGKGRVLSQAQLNERIVKA